MLTDICRSQLNDKNNDFPFFNKATAGVDCNVAMCSEAVELVTGAKLSALQVRTAGSDMLGGTGLVLARRVFRSQKMVAGTDYIMLKNEPTTTVRDLLQDKWFVVLFIKYDVMRQQAPDVVGDGKYGKAHAIAIADWWRSKRVRKVHYYDPLNDGRQSASLGGTAPKGMQTVAFSAVREAAWAYSIAYEESQTGFVFGYAVKPRPQPQPVEEP